MKEIKLTQGIVTLVDDEDFEYLNQFKWYAINAPRTYYATRNSRIKPGKQKTIYMHREILNLTDSKVFCDHRDRNGLNNLRSNLRIATPAQNQANRNSRKNSTSKYIGVCLKITKTNNRIYTYWIAQIKNGSKIINLGLFKIETDAALAYNKAAEEMYGQFANINVINLRQ
jgi:hypothetical protein